ncbi:DMT family transporter [Bacillus massiliigorillae]|uniref:DMT family transporter n=1 Tax=Bacillus massiliigorillae TaxID=1243664 RepID=UPI0003A96E20|nr:DMT family transporter [Bacillus massiliigorillae]
MNKSLVADLTLLLVVLIWGATFVVVQDAISFLTPFSFNAVRFFIAFVALAIFYIFFTKKKAKTFNKATIQAGAMLGFWLFLAYGLQTLGLLYTTPAKTGFITGLSVVLVPVFSFFLLKMRPNRNVIIGIICATIGLYMITMLQASAFSKGDFFVLLGAICFAMHIITTSKYAKNFQALPLTIVQILTVSVFSFVVSLFLENPKEMYRIDVLFQKEVIMGLLITALLATAFAFLAQTYFQAYTSPTRVALIFAMEPVFAAITSYFVINETFTTTMLIGCILIFAGIIFAELPVKKQPIAEGSSIES